jgi:signal peptidase I
MSEKNHPNVFIDTAQAIFKGFAYGLGDLLPFKKKGPRETPAEEVTNSDSWHKYYRNREWRNYIISEAIAQILVVIILLILIRTTLGEFRFIPSESMEPTLKIGDKLAVEKVSRLKNLLTGSNYNRGDIVIFYPPPNATGSREIIHNDPLSILGRLTGLPFLPQTEAYIKRLLGVPGDTIEVKAGKGVYINGMLIREPYHEQSPAYLPNYDFGPVKVPEDHYFVLGDNRNFSFDSHYWGFLPQKRVIGRAAFILYRDLGTKPQISPKSYQE